MIKAIQIFRGILKGVAYLHSKGIIHGDLKVSNVMIEDTWEELPNDLSDSPFTESNELFAPFSRTSTPTNNEFLLSAESPWSPKPSPIPVEELKESKGDPVMFQSARIHKLGIRITNIPISKSELLC